MKISIKDFKESLSKNLCPFCNEEMKFYDGSLGYEANKCDCGFYTDHTGIHIEEVTKDKKEPTVQIETFTYKGKKYPTMLICLKHPELYPKGFWQKISIASFSDALTKGTGEYTEPRAIELDEQIYSYVPDDVFEKADLKDIAENYLDEKFESIEEPEEEDVDFQKAYNILMDYWESFPDDEKPEINKRLNEVGL